MAVVEGQRHPAARLRDSSEHPGPRRPVDAQVPLARPGKIAGIVAHRRDRPVSAGEGGPSGHPGHPPEARGDTSAIRAMRLPAASKTSTVTPSVGERSRTRNEKTTLSWCTRGRGRFRSTAPRAVWYPPPGPSPRCRSDPRRPWRALPRHSCRRVPVIRSPGPATRCGPRRVPRCACSTLGPRGLPGGAPVLKVRRLGHRDSDHGPILPTVAVRREGAGRHTDVDLRGRLSAVTCTSVLSARVPSLAVARTSAGPS